MRKVTQGAHVKVCGGCGPRCERGNEAELQTLEGKICDPIGNRRSYKKTDAQGNTGKTRWPRSPPTLGRIPPNHLWWPAQPCCRNHQQASNTVSGSPVDDLGSLWKRGGCQLPWKGFILETWEVGTFLVLGSLNWTAAGLRVKTGVELWTVSTWWWVGSAGREENQTRQTQANREHLFGSSGRTHLQGSLPEEFWSGPEGDQVDRVLHLCCWCGYLELLGRSLVLPRQ